MNRLTERNENGDILIIELEERKNLLKTYTKNAAVTYNELLKIMYHLAEKLADYEDKEEKTS